jgi:transketolase
MANPAPANDSAHQSASNDDLHAIALLKGIVLDGVDAASSGHPGGAMGSMDLAYILFKEFLRFDPTNPDWKGRDRFVLSAGHMSMQLYALLYANGWLKKADLGDFRQLHSRTPGHPENYMTDGVECTTGPLGQGCAMSVGMAVAAAHMGAAISGDLFSNRTFCLLGDGCLQEGVTLASASLAGHWKLGNLVWIYDKNRIQISGNIDRATTDDEAKLFEGFGWDVQTIDGHDHAAIRKAYAAALQEGRKPSIIIANTTMAKGSATQEGSHKTHGAPFKPDELAATKKTLGIPDGETFYWDQKAEAAYREGFAAKTDQSKSWQTQKDAWLEASENKATWQKFFEPVDGSKLPAIEWDTEKPMATRQAFGKILESWMEKLPNLLGGSADLEPSNMTEGFAKAVGDFDGTNPLARNLAFGVREFPMAAICNGMALFGGIKPFSATFLSFADYSRPALRLGAIQKIGVIHEFTHDSFYLGEDGPTHQPVEHVMSLRLIPNFYVLRPADTSESEVMMRKAMDLSAPSAICLTRQKLAHLKLDASKKADCARGGYILREGKARVIFATGSEVHLALKVADSLGDTSVVSVPCWELFFEQDESYIAKVLQEGTQQRISIEAGSTLGWERFVGRSGLMIGLDHFGESAPASELEKLYGFTPEAVIEKISAKFSVS